MKIATALMFVYLSIVALLVTSILLGSEPVSNSLVAATGNVLIYVVVVLTIAMLLILFRSRSNEVLLTLAPDRAYVVLSRNIDDRGNNILTLGDAVAKKRLLAVFSEYPPKGFREVHPRGGGTVLLPLR
ncbi:MAG: hypothetical protein WC791_04745 [Candidatus Paceibacterota bacterium]